MPEIVPAIIAKDFEELRQKIESVGPYVKWVQLDVSDGKFTSMKTWPFANAQGKPFDTSNAQGKLAELKKTETNLDLEAHLMISEPEKSIEGWIESGVKRILIHFESTERLNEVICRIREAGLEAGVVLNLQTPIDALDKIEDLENNLQVIQLMGISEIGYYGHPFSDRVIPKIFSLRVKFRNVKIAIDGGINSKTAKKAAQAGADILVAGSAIFREENIEEAIKKLKESIK